MDCWVKKNANGNRVAWHISGWLGIDFFYYKAYYLDLLKLT